MGYFKSCLQRCLTWENHHVAQREVCPTSGQLELTLFNPLDHLESPCCTAHWDYPRIIRATEVIYVSVAVFLLVFGTFVADADRVNADDLAALAQGCVTLWFGVWELAAPPFFCVDTKGKLSAPPRSVGRGGLSGERTTSCHHKMIYWEETQSQLL